ncbi:ATP-binding protein [Erysipelothrix rhusiopathiae]|nr:ATP-binding protein [Erysipelothrix rhusiopathiae]MDE8069215.1 ATP-binding protein [Erysipelothrix rhusiopathiae]MDE8115192.1 ATP-binding protein [Erysipelothrix rhusiopathiae]MDE8207830.1 ATP-binding protein [Erysipelothrix rhusiopathiae]
MITIPNLSTYNSIESARTLKANLILNQEPKVKFNLTAIRNCDPFAMIIVGLAIRDILHDREVIAENLNDINDYAGSMCFYDFIGVKNLGLKVNSRSGSTKHIPITIVRKSILMEKCRNQNKEFIDALREYSFRVAKVLSRNYPESEIAFEYLIREMIRNIFEHSESECAYICGQYWPSYDLIEIAIADDGIGIKNSLKSNMNYINLIENDNDAIKLAMRPGVSKSYSKSENPIFNPDKNSGFGLYVVSELCIALDGSFIITSGRNSKHIGRSSENSGLLIKESISNHNGTAIMIRIKPTMLVDFDNIFDSIIEKGEELAKQDKLAFSKSSSLSRKLSRDLY